MSADAADPAESAEEGLRAGPPDYVGVGTDGSGTEWWHRLIRRHPRAYRLPSTPAEVRFFDDGWRTELDETAVERYHAFFARPHGRFSGEWSPGYMAQPWTPWQLHRVAPQSRLLVLLRDPVERFRCDRSAEQRRAGGATSRATANAAFGRGLYADQLLRLWRAFPRVQVLVLQLEHCIADAAGQLARTYEFLGLGSDVPADLATAEPFDTGPGRAPALSDWQIEELTRDYAPENERLAALVPDLDLSLWRQRR